MLFAVSVVIILIVAWTQYRNGLASAVFMLMAVLLAGLVAFDLWEPLADFLEPVLAQTAVKGCEDMLALTFIFGVVLLILRVAVFNYLAPNLIDQHGMLQFLGAGAVGLLTGYFVTGFLIAAMQTLPLDERFLDMSLPSDTPTPWRSWMPPDRLWLAMMRQASAYALSGKEENPQGETTYDRYSTFDKHGTFELRYQRYRRNTDTRGPMPYYGEFDKELYGRVKQR
jgi:hypothetical protein